MGNCKVISLSEAYRKILTGTQIDDTGLDSKSIQKLKLFTEYSESDILQTELRKKTGLSRSSIYQLRKVQQKDL